VFKDYLYEFVKTKASFLKTPRKALDSSSRRLERSLQRLACVNLVCFRI